MNVPFFSIFMACRNAQNAIGDSIKSVRSQNNRDWELFVIDDASEDATWDRAQQAADGDGRIRLQRNTKRQRKLQNFLETVPKMSGTKIVEIDGDDFLLRNDALDLIGGADATVGRFMDGRTGGGCGYSSGNVSAPQRRPRYENWLHFLFAPRTWNRAITTWSLKELPQTYIDPVSGGPWPSSMDTAMFSPAVCFARSIVDTGHNIYEIGDLGLHDHHEDKALQYRCSTALHEMWLKIDREWDHENNPTPWLSK